MKKQLPILLSLTALFSTTVLAGCNKTKAKDTPQTLEIYAWNGGYGVEWLKLMIDEFKQQDWVKEKYPQLEILSPTINDVFSYAASRLSMGSKNTTDLMFTPGAREFGLSGALAELTDDVYNQPVPGESILWKDKVDPSFNKSNEVTDPNNPNDVKYYSVSWAGGMNGIIYNETILNSFGIKVPNTTNELIAACATIKANQGQNNNKYNKGYSFIQSYDSYENFDDRLFPQWWAQYEGKEGYINFYSGIDSNRYSKNIFNQQGRKYSLEVFNDLLAYSKGYAAPESARYEFMQAQLLFLQGNGVFHANGDWFDNEMRELAKEIKNMDTFKTMRTPIISRLGEKLGITDSELSKIIDYVDGNGALIDFESTTGYTDEEVVEEITAARGIVYSIGPNHQAVIPSHAQAKDVAIDFLRFMATDVALEAYIKGTQGNNLPFKYNVKEKNPELYATFSTVQQSRLDYMFNDRFETFTLPSESGFPLFNYGGLKPFIKNDFYSTFSASDNTKTPDDFMQETSNYWTDARWQKALKDSGLAS